MKVAFFSPLPPARSGIADYSEALIEQLRDRVDLQVFESAAKTFDADIAVYQIGNNGFHDFAYETALKHPGVVVLHESNLHHLIADITIRRGDWDAYLREAEYNGGAGALGSARRGKGLGKGPHYEGLPMRRGVFGGGPGGLRPTRVHGGGG